MVSNWILLLPGILVIIIFVVINIYIIKYKNKKSEQDKLDSEYKKIKRKYHD